MVTKTIDVAVIQREISREELRTDPFYKDVIPYLEDQVLISLVQDLYYAIEESPKNPRWEVLGAYHATRELLEDRGYTVAPDEIEPNDYKLVIVGPRMEIPL